jgi:hypothetical protein
LAYLPAATYWKSSRRKEIRLFTDAAYRKSDKRRKEIRLFTDAAYRKCTVLKINVQGMGGLVRKKKGIGGPEINTGRKA